MAHVPPAARILPSGDHAQTALADGILTVCRHSRDARSNIAIVFSPETATALPSGDQVEWPDSKPEAGIRSVSPCDSTSTILSAPFSNDATSRPSGESEASSP